jgi:F420-0:gamma-glutamyl ligase
VTLTGVQTDLVRAGETDILDFIDKFVPELPPKSVLAITSKVVSLCENRVVKIGEVSKEELVRAEAEYFLPPEANPYGVMVTITRGVLIAAAGIDESNTDGYYVLWPEDPQASANRIREHLQKKFGPEIGVVITDSRLTPLRWGIVGFGLAHSGFEALTNYVGQKDIFSKYTLKYSYGSQIDGLATAAVMIMGEGAQRMPLVRIEDAETVVFQNRNPTDAELGQLRISIDDDLYSDMLKNIPWEKRPGQP